MKPSRWVKTGCMGDTGKAHSGTFLTVSPQSSHTNETILALLLRAKVCKWQQARGVGASEEAEPSLANPRSALCAESDI